MSTFGTFIVVAYTLLGVLVVGALYYFIRKWRWRWILVTSLSLGLVALAAAPFMEEARIASRFEELCKGSRMQILRKVEAAGYFNDIGRNSPTPGPITDPAAIKEYARLGFQFVEFRGYSIRSDTPFFRVEKGTAGWEVKPIDHPTARYRLAETLAGSFADIPVGHKLWMQEQVIIDTRTNEIVARDTIYKRTANTIDQAWMNLIGSTLRLCPDFSEGRRRGGG